MLRTFILVNIGWLCDACTSASQVFKALGNIFVDFRVRDVFNGSLLKMGLNMRDYHVLLVLLLCLLLLVYLKRRMLTSGSG